MSYNHRDRTKIRVDLRGGLSLVLSLLDLYYFYICDGYPGQNCRLMRGSIIVVLDNIAFAVRSHKHGLFELGI